MMMKLVGGVHILGRHIASSGEKKVGLEGADAINVQNE